MDRYTEMMERLQDPKSWDIPGILADVAGRLIEEGDEEAAAVVNTLWGRLQDIARLISYEKDWVIDPVSVRDAGEIAAMFMSNSPTKP